MSFDPIVYVADAGSMAKDNFHWVCSSSMNCSSQCPEELAECIAKDLAEGGKVALGYESPLFTPCDESSELLGKARPNENGKATGNKSFNAGAGASVLATGIQSLAWVLRAIKEKTPSSTATTVWTEFCNDKSNLFVWEAFVTGSEKGDSHEEDARLAIKAFQTTVRVGDPESKINCAKAFSLAGAAILFAALSKDLSLLSKQCLVLRPVFPTEEAELRLAQYQQRKNEKKQTKKLARDAKLQSEVQKILRRNHGV